MIIYNKQYHFILISIIIIVLHSIVNVEIKDKKNKKSIRPIKYNINKDFFIKLFITTILIRIILGTHHSEFYTSYDNFIKSIEGFITISFLGDMLYNILYNVIY